MARVAAYTFARLRPSKFRLIGSVNQNAPLLAGEGLKVPFTAAALGFQQLWFTTPGPRNDMVERYLILKTTVACHVAFGPVGMAAVTTGDALLEPGDAMQDFQTQQGDCGFDVIGDTTTGTLYLWVASP